MLSVLDVGHLGLVGPEGSDQNTRNADKEAAGPSADPSFFKNPIAYEIFLHKSVVSVSRYQRHPQFDHRLGHQILTDSVLLDGLSVRGKLVRRDVGAGRKGPCPGGSECGSCED